MKLLPAVLLLCLFGCAADRPAKSITPRSVVTHADWTDAERRADLARRDLFTDQSSSHFLILLKGAEPPHVHDKSDMTVFLRRGNVRLHLAGRIIDMAPGDVAFIPRGAIHWGVNLGPDSSEAYVVATPPMSPDDRRLVPVP